MMRRLALAAALLALGCDRAPSEPDALVLYAAGGTVAYTAGACTADPVGIVAAVEAGMARATREREDVSLGLLRVVGREGVPAGAYYPPDLVIYRCGDESVLSHEVGHVVAARLGLGCWRRVWHELDLWCEGIA